MEAVRSTAEWPIESMNDFPAALRYAIRARSLTKDKDAAVLGYAAEAYGLNREYSSAIDAARIGLALAPPKPGASPNRLQQWLLDEIAEYTAKSRQGHN